MPDFQQRLREALDLRHLSPGQLSMKTGGRISARTIFRWLAGESEPLISALGLLCPALDVTADWLCALDCSTDDQTSAALIAA